MIEVVGNITNKTITILIDSRASNSYISPNLVEKCHLKKSKLETASLVQLATGAKRKITEFVKVCPLEMNGMKTFEVLNIIPLGSYDVLIGMDWLDAHHVVLYFHNKTYTCLDEEGNQVTIKGILRPISPRKIIALQLKKCLRKGCQLYAIHVEE